MDVPRPDERALPMRILVTGGSGFIGTNLVESLLASGAEVLNIDSASPNCDHHRGIWKRVDILNRESLLAEVACFQPTHVVHLAARTDLNERKSLSGYRVNIDGTQHVLDAVQATPSVERVIMTSSMLVCPLGYRPKSDTDYAPASLYGESKVLGEKHTRAANLSCVWTIVRPTTIWGPWHHRLRAGFFRILRSGWYFHPAGIATYRSYDFVGNTTHQILRLLQAPASRVAGRTFYLSDAAIDLHEWVNQFSLRLRGKKVRTMPVSLLRQGARLGDAAGAIGLRLPLNSYRLQNMTCDNVLDIGPTLQVTGPQPYSVEDGIEITSQWLEGHVDGVAPWVKGEKPSRRAAAAA